MSDGRRPTTALILVGALAAVTLLTVYAFVSVPWRTPLASVEGEGIDRVINYLLVATGCILVAGHLVLCLFIWKGSGGEQEYRRPSMKTQWLWSLAPVVVMTTLAEVGVIVLGEPAWARMFIEPPKDPFVVEVVGKQFEWIAHYPGKDGQLGKTVPKLVHDQRNPLGLSEQDPAARDDVVVRGTLRLPLDRDCLIRLRTQDVIHSFFVPPFRVKQDLIPGFETKKRIRPTRAGTYEIACAELCGAGHYKMRGICEVLPQKEMEEWISQQKGWFED